MKWMTPLTVAAAASAIACGGDRTLNPSSPTAPAPLLAVADAYGGGPIHGAIFTTTPNGGIVNENVRYTDKREVYLDGGPPGHAPITAAGLPNGLYVFQITDPPGKVLLSDDPAKCRVVQVSGGVIVALVKPADIPAPYGPLANTYGTGKGSPCHVQDSPDGVAGASGRHDTNTDVDHGAEGAIVVQMMPFLDTPNPGGVYKAWMTPLKEYAAKGGKLDVQTRATTVQGKTVGYARDPGFAPPLSKVKTDNFKVRENPPFIRIDKLVDANRDGEPAGDASYPNPPGWPVTVEEPVEGGTVVNNYLAPTNNIGVPQGSTITVCEAMQNGWRFSYAVVDGQKVAATSKVVDGTTYYCVTVTVGTGGTVAIAFGNIKAAPKARIAIAPPIATNAVNTGHQLTATVQIDHDLGAGWENAPDGTTIAFLILSGPGSLSPTSCTTSGATGACGTTLTSSVAGVTTVEASSALTVDETPLSVKTDGVAPNSGPAKKIWVDARISISPPTATNGIFEPHALTGKVLINLGDPDQFVNAPDGTTITFLILSGPGSLSPASCTTAGGTGACGTTLTSSVAGTTLVQASTQVTVSGQTMTRTTDGQAGNSGPAEKLWIVGSLTWEKHDAFGARLAGATFAACRIADRFGTATSDPCITVKDNLAPDASATAGVFKLIDLALGTWKVTETVAPPGYEIDPAAQSVILTTASPNGVLGPFINRIPGQALTPGYWKNHQAQLEKYLPLSLGSFSVTSYATAKTIFDAMNCSSSSDQDAIGCLAGHLQASKLNVANGASSCIAGTITSADAFLTAIGYAGPGKIYRLSPSQRTTAIGLKDALDAYNNNVGCNKT